MAAPIRRVLGREWGRLKASRRIQITSVVLPLFLMLFFVALLRNTSLRALPIALCDEDKTPLSRRLERMLEAAPAIRIAYDVNSPLEAERLLREGQIHAWVLIPEGFEKRLQSAEEASALGVVSGTNLSANGALNRDLQLTFSTFSAGVSLTLYESLGFSSSEAMTQVQPIRMATHTLFNPTPDYTLYLAPSFLAMMLLLSVLLTTILTIGEELREGSAGMWHHTAEGSLWAAVVGKLAPYTWIHLTLAQILFILLEWGLGVPIRGSLGMLELGTLLLILTYQAIGLTLVAATGNLRLALSLGGGYGVAAFSFSGLTFPTLAMYPAMRVLSNLFPFTLYTQLLLDQTLRGTPLLISLRPLTGLLLFLLLPLPFLELLKRRLTGQNEWGRS